MKEKVFYDTMDDKRFFNVISPGVGPSKDLELEPVVNESDPFDFESALFYNLINEGKHQVFLESKPPVPPYDEKIIRDSVAHDVAHPLFGDISLKSLPRKRKAQQIDSKNRCQDNRERNREHAKNTRLRKKAYVIKMKELAETLERQKYEEEFERRRHGSSCYNLNVIGRNLVRLFLSYRETNMQSRAAWENILDENFVLTLPITPYRSFLKKDVNSGCRILDGIDSVMADTGSLFVMVESVGQGHPQWKNSIKRGSTCRVKYRVDPADFHCSGGLVMCRYTMRTDGGGDTYPNSGIVPQHHPVDRSKRSPHGNRNSNSPSSNGSGTDCRNGLGSGGVSPDSQSNKTSIEMICEQHGMLLCRFDPARNKLLAVEMVFDVMGFMQQLQRATSVSPECSVVPNTVGMALQPSKEARTIIRSDPPFPVLHVNEAWTELTGIKQSFAEGKPLSEVLNLMPSQYEHLYSLVTGCLLGKPGSAVLITQCPMTPDEPSLIYLKVLPLSSTSEAESSITHLLGVQTDLPLTVTEKNALLIYCHSNPLNSPLPSSLPPQPQLQPYLAPDIFQSRSSAVQPFLYSPAIIDAAIPTDQSVPIAFNQFTNRFVDVPVIKNLNVPSTIYGLPSSLNDPLTGLVSLNPSTIPQIIGEGTNFTTLSDLPSTFHGVSPADMYFSSNSVCRSVPTSASAPSHSSSSSSAGSINGNNYSTINSTVNMQQPVGKVNQPYTPGVIATYPHIPTILPLVEESKSMAGGVVIDGGGGRFTTTPIPGSIHTQAVLAVNKRFTSQRSKN